MSTKKKVNLTFDLGQVCNDVLVKCNLISQAIKDVAMEDIKANVQAPDDPENRSIINRAVTEAFGEVKSMCQRYMIVGRSIDDNKLETLISSSEQGMVPMNVRSTYKDGNDVVHDLYTADVEGVTGKQDVWYDSTNEVWYIAENDETSYQTSAISNATPKYETKMVPGVEITNIVYETVTLELWIPNFNLSVTDHLKSCIHKYVVDYVMGRFLQDQVADKAGEYNTLAEDTDRPKIISALNSRERYTMRTPSFM